MSEPRKINISGSSSAPGASRSIRTGASHSAYADPRMEEARARARADAEAARQRRSQQFPRVRQAPAASGAQVQHLDLNRAQGSKPAYDVNNDAEFEVRQRRREQARTAATQQAAGQAARPAPQPARTVSQPAAAPQPRPAASAPRQIHRSGTTAGQGGRTIHRAPQAQQSRPAGQAAQPRQAAQPAQAAPQQPVTPHPDLTRASVGTSSRSGGGRGVRVDQRSADRPGAGNGGAGGQPPRGPGRGRKGSGGDGSGRGRRKKSRLKWWQILLGTLAVIALIFAGTLGLIMNAIRPEGSSISISELLNTPKEYSGDQLNILVIGVDRSTQGGDMTAGSASDSQSNDGMTDMIMYVQLDFVNNEVRMLQLPRNIMVTTDYDVSHNYQINNVAMTQGSDGLNNYNALAEIIHEQFGLYIDGYVSIRLEALVQLVDTLGPIQVYVPETIDYGDGSRLEQGLQWMDGATAEFFLRARKTYATGDLQRLNTQRYFYAAMFARLRSMTVWDIAKILPVVMNYMETDLPISDLVSVAVSLLKISSDHIMLCQVPVYMGQLYYPQDSAHPNDVVVVARNETADLLNSYFRTADNQVPADQLGICDGAIDVSGRTPSDPNVQYMGTLNENVVTAAEEEGAAENPDAVYDLPEPSPSPDPAAASGSTDGSEESSDTGNDAA